MSGRGPGKDRGKGHHGGIGRGRALFAEDPEGAEFQRAPGENGTTVTAASLVAALAMAAMALLFAYKRLHRKDGRKKRIERSKLDGPLLSHEEEDTRSEENV